MGASNVAAPCSPSLRWHPARRWKSGGRPEPFQTARTRSPPSWSKARRFSINAWRTLAENVAETLTRGANVIVVGRLQQRSWETQEGDKRTVVEIEADEIGPSLRWATAKVEKQGRSGGAGADWGSERVAAGVGGGGEETPLDAG